MSGGESVRIDLDVDTEPLEDHLRATSEEWSAHSRAIRMAIGEKIVGGMKREAGVNTGRLRGTVRQVESDGTTKIVAGGNQGVNYTLEHLEGTNPHRPGSPNPSENVSLARWARRNNYPGGFDSIYWHIAKYGTEANDFVSDPLRDAESSSGRIADRVLQSRGAFDG